MPARKAPPLPDLLDRKIYKTGQTRGADDDQIYQNRVGRNSTVLIPLPVYLRFNRFSEFDFENGFIVIIRPSDYFNEWVQRGLESIGLELGNNALIFYELREDWLRWNPQNYGFTVPKSRKAPLGGGFVARIANTTSATASRINEGYTTTGLKGAGIRLYEYASLEVTRNCRSQLEAAFWLCVDAIDAMVDAGMAAVDAEERSAYAKAEAAKAGLLDYDQLKENRIVNANHELTCPLCLKRLSARGFVSRLTQAAGRERHDLTVTEVNLFHIHELAYGIFNHRPYNLGWGHHHCNVVCKDAGIDETLRWMESVIERNKLH